MPRWFAAIAIYLEPRVLAVLVLGFCSGLPLALTGQTLAVWMRETGTSLTVIGLFALVGLPYSLKFLWAPLFDAVSVPLLGRLLGRRRAWLLTTQACLMLAVVGLGLNDPVQRPWLTALLALVVAFCSASQDVMIDAFRVESLEESRLAAGMANYVAGYRVAMLVSTAGAFEIASRMQAAGLEGASGWGATYAVMAALLIAGVITVLASREPDEADGAAARRQLPFGERLRAAVIEPLMDFALRPHWLAIMLFIVLFKFGDALAGLMTAPFVLDLGFDKVEYGRVVKVFGFAATLLGGFAGGSLFRLRGARQSLWLGGIAQTASNLMFVWLAQVGASMPLLIASIGVENFAGGFGSVVFVGFLSSLCRNRAFTATQYALLSALSAVGRTSLVSSAGALAEAFGWSGYFLFTVAAGVPGLALLWILSRRPDGALADTAAVTPKEAI